MPLLKEVPREVEEGKKRERRWVRRLWMKKNWKWFVPACVGAIVALVLLVLLIVGIVWYSQRRPCYFAHLLPFLVTEIRIGSGECNIEEFPVLDLSRFKNLKSVFIGDGSYKYVDELKMIGLNKLERVVIGSDSFTKKKNGFGKESNRRFYVKNCPSLRELRVGCYSFSDYVSAVIEGNDALEVIAMGELSSESFNFNSASLKLKSVGWMEC